MATDVQYIAALPVAGSVDVAPNTELALTVYAPSGIDPASVTVTVDGVAAYDAATSRFVRPAFAGTVAMPNADYLTMRFRPRRPFLYNVKPSVIVGVASFGFPSPLTYRFDFVTRLPSGTLLDAALRQTAVDRGNTTYPAVEAFRQAMLATVRGSPATSALVVLYYRVVASPLRGLLYLAPFANRAAGEVAQLRRVDLGSTDDGAATFARLQPLWELALKELIALGVAAETVKLLFDAGRSPNGPDQVAAACALILLATQRLIDTGVIAP